MVDLVVDGNTCHNTAEASARAIHWYERLERIAKRRVWRWEVKP
jgi:hypothetical protein